MSDAIDKDRLGPGTTAPESDAIDQDRPGPETTDLDTMTDRLDLSAWEPQLPSAGFADRLFERLEAEERGARGPAPALVPPPAGLPPAGLPPAGLPPAGLPPVGLRSVPPGLGDGRGLRERRGGRAVRALGALLLAAALGASVVWFRAGPADHGVVIASERQEVLIGSRARAVLEPGARVRWNGDEVTQERGDVFYRVEPGARFRVLSLAGEVEVKGTCFTVKIRGDGPDQPIDGLMIYRRDIKPMAVGAALSALMLVSVYEGKVVLARDADRLDLRAGEGAIAGPGGVRKAGSIREGERRLEQESAGAEDGQLAQANQNLSAQVEVYRSRLEALAAQRNELEKKLHMTEEQLAARQPGAAQAPTHSPYDPTPEEWAELAKKGTIKYRVPCLDQDHWTRASSPERLNKMGLAPDDGAQLKGAYERSSQRIWSQIRPLCSQVLGASGEVIDKLGPETCSRLVYELSLKSDREAATEAQTEAAEIRAGLRPEPGPGDPQHPVLKMFLLMTGAQKVFESDLAASVGPDEAHRIANSEGLCAWQSTIGGGKERGGGK